MKLQPWKIFTDTSEHYKVFQAVRGYSTGMYTKDEFKSQLKNIDLSDLDSYREHIKALIKDVLNDKPVVDESVEEPVEVEIVMEESTTEEKPFAKAIASRKRNYKVEAE